MPGKIIHKFGIGRGIGTSFEAISNLGSFNWLTAADAVRVKAGGNAADTAAGAGARKVIVEGLDSNWNIASEEITLAGASASSSTATEFVRIYRAYVTECGAYGGSNTGNVVIETEAGTDLIQLDAGESQSQYAAFSVPVGFAAKVSSIHVFADSSKSTSVRMFARTGADVVSAPFKSSNLKLLKPGIDSLSQFDTHEPLIFSEKTDIYFEGKVDSTTADIAVDFELEIVEV